MMPIRIDDYDDPRIASYRAMRDRDLTGRGGRFVAEGEVVLQRLLAASRHQVESILLLDRRLARFKPLLRITDPGIPVHVVSRAVIDLLVGFPMHRGVLAIGLRAPEPEPSALLASLPDRAVALGLIGLTNHDNVGSIFRNAAAFGADAVLLDETCCDPLYRKAIRVSVGASLTVPFTRAGSAQAMLGQLSEAGFQAFAFSPAGREEVDDVAWPVRAGLIFGAEGEGLPATVLEQCRSVRIPICAGFDSLNVATASGIALHALRSHAGAGRHEVGASGSDRSKQQHR